MARVGIDPDRAMGVRVPDLRALAKKIGRNSALAHVLWDRNIRETMILASMVDDPQSLTGGRMDAMALEFYDWEVCDQTCMNLFEKTGPLAWVKAVEWACRPEEGVRRAGYVLMARLAVSDKKAGEEKFHPFFPLIVQGSVDQRNLVKKAVNWALRQIGKRTRALNEKAIVCGRTVAALDSPSARWVAADALKELTSPSVQGWLAKRAGREPGRPKT
jgi:3-methyladenine DNA glycosylase AlkD